MRRVVSGVFGLFLLVDSVGCVDSAVVSQVDAGSLDGGVAQELVLQPEGGEASLGAVRLTVPAGAVRAATTIRVRTYGSGPAGFDPRSPLFEFEPAGLTFDPPLTVSFDAPIGTERLGWVWSRSDGSGYYMLEGTSEGGRITGQVHHFSRGAVVSYPDLFDMCVGECPDGFAWSASSVRCEAAGQAPAFWHSCTRIAGRSYRSCEGCADGYHVGETELTQRCGAARTLIDICEQIGDSQTLLTCERSCPLGFRAETSPISIVPNGCGASPTPWTRLYCVRNERCLPSNCPGCCAAEVCTAGNLTSRCGAGGAACRACPSGQVCSGGQCVDSCGPANCTGCCDSGGRCVGGASDTVCGQGGALCARCNADQQCSGGRCVPRCGPGNCAGCCAATGVCVTSTSNESCGQGGALCATCGSSQRCDAGACVAACPDVAGLYSGTRVGPLGPSAVTGMEVFVDSQCVVRVGFAFGPGQRIENGQLRQVGDCNLERVSDAECCDWTFAGASLTGTCITHLTAVCDVPGRCAGVCHGLVCGQSYSYQLTRLSRCNSNGDCASLQVCSAGQCRPCALSCVVGAACGENGRCTTWGNGCSVCGPMM